MTMVAPGAKAELAVEDDGPIPYMQRTRDYYVALGYGNPYRLGPLRRGAIHAAAHAAEPGPRGPDHHGGPVSARAGNQEPGAPYNAAAKFYQVYSIPSESVPDLRISHVGYDRKHSSAADIHAYFPLARMKEAAAAGRIGSLGPRVHGAPTNRSHRATETDAADLRRRCQEDSVDAAVLVPS